MKIPIKVIYLIAAVIALTIIILAFLPDKKETENNGRQGNVDYDKLDEIVFKVKIDTIKKGSLVQKITANGIVRADKDLDISASISGVISEVNIYDGKFVNKNDVLIKLDDREYRINLREAEERLIEAKVNYGFLIKDVPTDSTKSEEKEIISKQLKELEKKYENSLISEKEYLEKKDELDLKLIFTGAKREELILNKSGYNAAINQIDKAKLKLDYTVIKAPFSGVIGNFDLVVGERIEAGNKLFKLFSTKTMKIDINILESELNKISIGNNVEIEIPALPGEAFTGEVSQISPYIDTENRTGKIVISIKNIDSKIKPGMFAKVLIASKIFNERILIPKEALLARDKRNLVFTVEDSLAKWKYVDIGKQNDKYIEILTGVNAGDVIIVEGHFNLAHDSKVKILN
ncbi:MAG: efflux RND transporter periplasmic adaptor subunit [Ignavibacteriae bacterium]|nr:efflux RND transporter periplasmic adaptor subunit [Ignavibacteriota bacterium]NOG97519.1 efflux RND transporter periplasmic adaptor subunit [Ignavibacteriota bacterium]